MGSEISELLREVDGWSQVPQGFVPASGGSTGDLGSWGSGPTSSASGGERISAWPESRLKMPMVSLATQPLPGPRPKLGSVGLIAGKYRLLEHLGSGGFGEAWKAIHRDLESPQVLPICLKLLYPQISGIRSVLAEARVMASMQHENLISIKDVGILDLPCGPTSFIAMELVGALTSDGDFVRATPLSEAGATADGRPAFSPRDAARIMIGICSGIDAAHRRGIVHRDLKPDNVLIEAGSLKPKVIDFGIAATVDGSLAGGPNDDRRTVGTPAFMAPEQLRGEFTPLTDVYALGGVLFYLLTGDLPYIARPSAGQGDPADDVMRQLADGLPPRDVLAIAPKTPKALAAIVRRAMARDPDDRYPTAAAMAEDVRAYLERRPTVAMDAAMPVRIGLWIWRNYLQVSLAVLCLAVVLQSIVTWVGHEQSRASAETAKRQHAEREWALAETQRREVEASLADRLVAEADAKAAEWRWSDARALLEQAEPLLKAHGRSTIGAQLKLWQTYQHAPPPLVTLTRESVSSVALSGDGRRVATGHRDGTIVVWDALSGTAICTLSLLKLPLPVRMEKIEPWMISAMSMSPDGRWLLTGGKDLRMTLWDLEKRTVAHQLGGHRNEIFSVALSPDGTMGLSGGWSSETWAWDLRNGEAMWKKPARRPTAGQTRDVAFTADNRFALALYTRQQGVTVFDARTGVEIRSIANGTQSPLSCMATDPANPERIAVGDGDGGVRMLNVVTGQTTMVLAGHRGRTARMSFTPDGGRLISAGDDGLLRIWDTRSGRQTGALQGSTESGQDMAISGDGRVVAVAAGSQTTLRAVNARPSADLAVADFPGADGWRSCVVAPEGRLGAVAGGAGIQVIDMATGKPLHQHKWRYKARPSAEYIRYIQFAPDEKELVWGDSARLAVMELATGQVTDVSLSGRGSVVGFSQDAELVALLRDEDIDIVSRRNLSVVQRFPGAGVGSIPRVDFTADGRSIVVVEDVTKRDRFVIGSDWVASAGLKLTRWDLATAQKTGEVHANGAAASAIVLWRDGSRVMTAAGERPAAVWDFGTGEKVFDLKVETGGIIAFDLAFDEQSIVTIGRLGRTMRVWDARTGQQTANLELDDLLQASHLRATADGRRVLIVGDGRVSGCHGIVRDFSRHEVIAALIRADHPMARNGPSTRPVESFPDGRDARELFTLRNGEWYALAGMHDWAAASIERSDRSCSDPSAVLARSHWLAGNYEAAFAEFRRCAASADAGDVGYFRICAQAARSREKKAAAGSN